MEALISVMLVWMVILTMAVVGIALLGIRAKQMLQRRTAELDLAAMLHHITRMVDRKALHHDRELREAVERFIARCKADPVTADRMFLNITELENALKHG
jgi:hypothetical protein